MTQDTESHKEYLSPPEVERVKYKRNFIKNAVCELRFPTLLELETKPPIDFQTKMRKQYPFYETQPNENTAAQESVTSIEKRYLFRSKDKAWTVAVTSSQLALETSNYTNFEEFSDRFKQILEYAKDLIDSDFFTRVGLRYINAIPIPHENESPKGWINSDLIKPVTDDVLGSLYTCANEYHGILEHGKYSMRHGYKIDEQNNKKTGVVNYILDFDYYDENVEYGDVLNLLTEFNGINFRLFSWCLGEKARELLGEGKLK